MNRSFLRILLAAFAWISADAHGQAPESFMVVEAHSGKVLVAANSGVQRPVASLTKIATGIIAVDWADAVGIDPNKTLIAVPGVATMLGGPNPMALQPGDRLTLRDALYSALLGSDNVAALAIADYVGRQLLQARGRTGDPVAAFVGEMNQLARGLGMTKTKFTNPHGLELPKRTGLSTAADMAKLTIYAMRKPGFTFMVRQKDRQVTVHAAGGGTRGYRVKNTNELIGQPGIIGVKTGTTQAAGPCLSVAADREPRIWTRPDGEKAVTPRRVVVVVLNSPDRFNRSRSLIGQGWSVYDRWVAAGTPVQNRRKEILDVPNLR